jgi:hypothetical protein
MVESILPPKVDPNVVPEWVTRSYQGMENDIEQWLVSYYFWKSWNGKEETLNTAKAKARAVAEAKYKSLSQTEALKEASDKSAMLQWYEANKSGWFNNVAEIEDVKELMGHILQEAKDNHKSSAYDIEFILNTLIPACEANGIAKEIIICIPRNMTKAKWGVASMREIMRNNGPEMKENLSRMVKAITDQTQSVDTFRNEIIPEIMGREKPKTLPSVPANVCLLPDGRELVIITSDPAHTRAIQMSTKSIVDGYGYTDPAYLLRELGNIVKPKATQRRRYKANVFDTLEECHDGGVYLPALESFKDLVIAEYLKHRFYLRKPGTQKLIVEEIGFSYNLQTFAEALGFKKDEDAFNALLKLYAPVIPEIPKMLPMEGLVITDLKVDLLNIEVGKPAYYLYLELNFGF